MAARKVVVRKSEFVGGAPMEARRGVRDWKLIYPETGVETKTLIMGIVEIPPGQRTPLHRHNCEEVYHVLAGRGEVEVEGERVPFEAGDAVFNTHPTETLRLLVVAGIKLVGLLPRWPTPGPYEILEA